MPIHESETDLALSFARLELTEVVAGKRSLDSCPGIKKLSEIGYGDYEQMAKNALKVVVPELGYGEDPLGFVIACFISQADRIKELTLKIENGDCRFHCRSRKVRRIMEPIPDYGDLMTMEDWREAVNQVAFINDDGVGHYSDGKKMLATVNIFPSMVAANTIEPGWSHIVWFNR